RPLTTDERAAVDRVIKKFANADSEGKSLAAGIASQIDHYTRRLGVSFQFAAQPPAIDAIEFIETKVNKAAFEFACHLPRGNRKSFCCGSQLHLLILFVEEFPPRLLTFLGSIVETIAERFAVSRHHYPA